MGEVASLNTWNHVRYSLGSLVCKISATKRPRKVFSEPSCDIQVWGVGRRALALGNLDLFNYFGNRVWYLLRGLY